jgi:hypothetical protein
MPSPTGITSGRWALETPATAMAPAPSIQISTLNSQFRPSGFSQTLAADPRRNHPTEKANSSTADLGRSGLATETQQTKFGSFAYDDSMHQESFLSFVQTEYLLRESRLGDSQSLTSVSAISAYPLMQINYAGWNLPVTLYNPSSKASEARW